MDVWEKKLTESSGTTAYLSDGETQDLPVHSECKNYIKKHSKFQFNINRKI